VVRGVVAGATQRRFAPAGRSSTLVPRLLASLRKFLPLLFLAGLVAPLVAAEWPRATTPLPPGVQLLSDVAYLEPTRTEKLDLFLPARAAGDTALRPAVVYFHGGGWDRGDKATERERNFGNHFAAAGYVFVSVNYKLGAGAWPQNLLDCKNAVRFVRVRAQDYGVDPERIAVMGASAGGHLALLTAYTTGQNEFEPGAPYPGVSSRVRAVVEFYGITNLLTRQAVADDGTPLGRTHDSRAPAMLGAKRAENPERWRVASPVTHVKPESPPTFITQGLSDETVDYVQAVELANVLRKNRVPHELLLLEGVGHIYHFDGTQKVATPPHLRTAVLAFLAQHLGPAPDARRN
jgi:acetyl esterase/lipase